jgi:hypothetical protein
VSDPYSATPSLGNEDWLNYSSRRAALSMMLDHARRSRKLGCTGPGVWMSSLMLGNVPPNPQADMMAVLPSIAAGWVWGYAKP